MLLEFKSIRMRLIEEADAEFILKLRLNEKYNKFLSSVNPDLQAQIDWIREYKKDEQAKKQFYFIIERLDSIPCGTFRIYDLNEEYFTLGSWILNENKTRYAVIECGILASKFGFEELGYNKYRFNVLKEHKRAISYYKRTGAIIIKEDDKKLYFELTDSAFYSSYEKAMAIINPKLNK